MLVLISYDIPQNKRRTKLAKILTDYGDRVQYSVFECRLTAKQLAQLEKELRRVMNEEEDNLRIYRLCNACEKQIRAWGKAEAPAEDPVLLIV